MPTRGASNSVALIQFSETLWWIFVGKSFQRPGITFCWKGERAYTTAFILTGCFPISSFVGIPIVILWFSFSPINSNCQQRRNEKRGRIETISSENTLYGNGLFRCLKSEPRPKIWKLTISYNNELFEAWGSLSSNPNTSFQQLFLLIITNIYILYINYI